LIVHAVEQVFLIARDGWPPPTVGEDRRAIGEACAVLLAAAGREPSDPAAVWEHGTADGHAAAVGWIKAGGWQAKSWTSKREKERCRRTLSKGSVFWFSGALEGATWA
jgi:hypothetical protein